MSDALANQIAAGEVVERPASVVKELVENSLDAGAQSVFVLIEKSGKDRIRVVDNGIGMSPEDAQLALQRHATSKLHSTDDLANISTLGFRGEALPSIASVSHFTLQTREASSSSGYELVVEGGKLAREGELGIPPGTIIDVRRLFENVPARRKFLRADVTESTHIAAQMSNLAVCYPDVHFRLEHGQRTILDAPTVSSRRERIYQIEKSWVETAVMLDEYVGSLGLQAWLSPPAESRGASARLHVYVNGRPVKDRILTHAVMEAYRQVSSKSGTPRVYLFVELPPDKIDVNVHPAKSEVRFVDQQLVHQAVFSSLKNALAGEGRAPEVFLGAGASRGGPTLLAREPVPSMSGMAGSSGLDMMDRAQALFAAPAPATTPTFAELADTPPTPIGQFRESYILASDDDGVWLIDQHAAHERILYEDLVGRSAGREQQLLLAPLPLELTPAERVTMEEELDQLLSFGYDIEPFGGDSYLVRGVPAALSGLDSLRLVRAALGEAERDCRSSTVIEAQSRIAARLACHAAIKVNFPLAMEKMQYLVRELWNAKQPTVCPHGRPTTLRIGLEQIERNFGRI
jgi:DNA mismatch repair protein MutL